MPQPAAGDRLRDDRALVADDRIVEAGLEGIGPDRLEHPAGHQDDVDAGGARRGDGGARARAQHRVLADQRPVEVARDRLDHAREIVGKLQPCGVVRKSTRAFRSFAGNDAYDFGMTLCG